ncbi:MAG TPA: hypothetical protein VJB98_01645 [Candidatus Paceibacterota bacterium]
MSYFVNLDNSRLDEQRRVMETIVAEGHCPFCLENLTKYHKEPVLKESDYWILTKNQWPYEGTRIHLLAIAKSHYEKLSELPSKAGEELISLMQWAEREFAIAGGSVFMRFGDMEYTGSTVKHIHAQLISGVPRLDSLGKENEKLKVKLAYKTNLPSA